MITFSDLTKRLLSINFDYYIQDDFYNDKTWKRDDSFKDKSGICIFTAFLSLLDIKLSESSVKKYFNKVYKQIYDPKQSFTKNKLQTGQQDFIVYFNELFKRHLKINYDVFQVLPYKNLQTYQNKFILHYGLDSLERYTGVFGHAVLCYNVKGDFVEYQDNSGTPYLFKGEQHMIGLTEYLITNRLFNEILSGNSYLIKLLQLDDKDLQELSKVSYQGDDDAFHSIIFNLDNKELLDKIFTKVFNKDYKGFFTQDNIKIVKKQLNLKIVRECLLDRLTFTKLSASYLKDKQSIDEKLSNMNFFKKLFMNFKADKSIAESIDKLVRKYSIVNTTRLLTLLNKLDDRNSELWKSIFYSLFKQIIINLKDLNTYKSYFTSIDDVRSDKLFKKASTKKLIDKLINEYDIVMIPKKDKLEKYSYRLARKKKLKYYRTNYEDLYKIILSISNDLGCTTSKLIEIKKYVFEQTNYDPLKQRRSNSD